MTTYQQRQAQELIRDYGWWFVLVGVICIILFIIICIVTIQLFRQGQYKDKDSQ